MKKIPPFKLIAEPLSDEARSLPKFKWAGPDVGDRHQLGGEPLFIQNTKFPLCTCCNKEMSFYAQLDSINDEFCIADCGMIYVFLCFDCYTAQALIHSS